MTFKTLLDNWKTTYAGIAMIVGGIVHLVFTIRDHGLSEADCTTTLLSIITGIGLISAGDAGAKPPTGSYTETTFEKKPPTTTQPSI